jgi:hypothetical protein
MFWQMYQTAESGASGTVIPVRFLSRYDKSAINIKEAAFLASIGQVSFHK